MPERTSPPSPPERLPWEGLLGGLAGCFVIGAIATGGVLYILAPKIWKATGSFSIQGNVTVTPAPYSSSPTPTTPPAQPSPPEPNPSPSESPEEEADDEPETAGTASPSSPSQSNQPEPPPRNATDPAWVEPLTVRQVKRQDGADLYVKNSSGYPITLSISLTERNNVKTIPPFPYTTTVSGGASSQLARIRNSGAGSWTYKYRYFYVDGDCKARHNPPSAYGLPYANGQSYPVTVVTGPEYHFEMPEETAVLAARPGTVVLAEKRYSQQGLSEEYYNKVNRVLILHDDGSMGAYYHLRPGGVVVNPGQFVNQGQLLGYSGQTGHISSPQLTFFVFKARDGRAKQLFPLRFKTSESEFTQLQSGHRYTAASAYTF